MNINFNVPVLGKCCVKSPIQLGYEHGDGIYNYVRNDERILYEKSFNCFLEYQKNGTIPLSFEKAGPREMIYFEPAKTKAAIVTCGGLCPGQNNVIRSIVMELFYRYNVTKIIGFQYGYEGLIPKYNHPYMELNPEVVDDIQLQGGSILGSSRGNQDVGEMVNTLERNNINILFCIGGDGTLRGAHEIQEEIKKRNLKISVAGIPKTIDNDINFIEKSFGFETAFSKAHEIISNAHNEAKGFYNGIVIIKLMGRDSGFIAAHATLSMQEVNFVLVPEMGEFELDGEKGFLNILKKRIENKHHALIVVAEGAGQHFFNNETLQKDASGNVKLNDIGIFLKDRIFEYFKNIEMPVSLKYIDPSYIIRSAPAVADDSKFCGQLAQNAVHGAMAGKTGFVAGIWSNQFTYLPIETTIGKRKKINLESELWWNVMEATGQPTSFKN
ncbi:MAG TPA: ATP-dependent 6-phosphofructokinase [Bacteroidales bacterium]|mgnify:CR=1 FL=1|nr:ATP-dependent 6-phosphofructokinase [Bacteroidales bacterium]HPS16443.1 ATP-dependent 6-phosphofructokinase [Bacteroidales bacterium]